MIKQHRKINSLEIGEEGFKMGFLKNLGKSYKSKAKNVYFNVGRRSS